jgi:hypothetical protein
MSVVSSGSHWEVIGGFIQDEGQLQQAGAQALRIALGANREAVQPVAGFGHKIGVSKIAMEQLRLDSHAEHFTELIQIFDRARQAIGSDTSDAYLNFFATFGTTGEHRDKIGEETLAVSLAGEGLAKIQDPETGEWGEFHLSPGDALYFDNNNAAEVARPLHVVTNTGVNHRISMAINF